MESIVIKKSFMEKFSIEEQLFLETQHQQGWKLNSKKPRHYVFERTLPQEYVYECFSLNEKDSEKAKDILKFFTDNEWEMVLNNNDEFFDFNLYYYRKLRTKADKDHPLSNSLKIQKIEKSYRKQIIYMLINLFALLFCFYCLNTSIIIKVTPIVVYSLIFFQSFLRNKSLIATLKYHPIADKFSRINYLRKEIKMEKIYIFLIFLYLVFLSFCSLSIKQYRFDFSLLIIALSFVLVILLINFILSIKLYKSIVTTLKNYNN